MKPVLLPLTVNVKYADWVFIFGAIVLGALVGLFVKWWASKITQDGTDSVPNLKQFGFWLWRQKFTIVIAAVGAGYAIFQSKYLGVGSFTRADVLGLSIATGVAVSAASLITTTIGLKVQATTASGGSKAPNAPRTPKAPTERAGAKPSKIIENSVEIDRSIEEVFDYLVDPRNEHDWNQHADIKQITDGPIKVGTEFQATWTGTKAIKMRCTGFNRPHGWSYQTHSRLETVDLQFSLRHHGRGTKLTSRFEVHPNVVLRPILPAVMRLMRRIEGQNLQLIKSAVEAHTASP